MFSFNNLSQQR